MSDELKDLKERISYLSDDELLKIIHVDFADYREEAIKIAADELQRRNIYEISNQKIDNLRNEPKYVTRSLEKFDLFGFESFKNIKIPNKESALKVIKELSIGFIFLFLISGIILIIVNPVLKYETILEMIVMVVVALLLFWLKSRIAAVLIFIFSILTVVVTLLNFLRITDIGGRNIFLAVMFFLMSIKAVEATFKFHGNFNVEGDSTNNLNENKSTQITKPTEDFLLEQKKLFNSGICPSCGDAIDKNLTKCFDCDFDFYENRLIE